MQKDTYVLTCPLPHVQHYFIRSHMGNALSLLFLSSRVTFPMLQVLRNGGSIPLFTLVKGFHNNKFSIDVLLRGINFNASLKNVDALS